jgi:hypothetical protein
MASEKNLKDLVHENQEKDDRIKRWKKKLGMGKEIRGALKNSGYALKESEQNSMTWKLTCMQTSKSSNSWQCKLWPNTT